MAANLMHHGIIEKHKRRHLIGKWQLDCQISDHLDEFTHMIVFNLTKLSMRQRHRQINRIGLKGDMLRKIGA